jgi:hypothetical protein
MTSNDALYEDSVNVQSKYSLRFAVSSLLPSLVTLRTVGERWRTKCALSKNVTLDS